MSGKFERDPDSGSLIEVDSALDRADSDGHRHAVDLAGGVSKPTTPYDADTKPEQHQASEMTIPYHGPGSETGFDPDDPMTDPPVGWLVVVDGPGKGRVATLRMGNNSIGRDADERVPLDYGDKSISRTKHATIVYDPRGRKFFVQPGHGTNLTYVNDDLVLTPCELGPFAHVQMGNTVLRFVPLCGAEFDWPEGREQTDGD